MVTMAGPSAALAQLDAFTSSHSHLTNFLLYSVLSLAGAFALACVSAVVETATYHAYCFLEREGLLRRLAPDIPVHQTSYKSATFKTFIGSLYGTYMLVLYLRQPLLATARPHWNWWNIYSNMWLISLIHDWWFWFVHANMHRVKALYRRIHAQHHVSEGDLTVFGTADMHLVEAFALTMGFYGGLLAFWAWRGSWNPVLFGAQVLLEASMNMGGHCGYLLPDWLQALVTAGIGNTPWSACSTTHYIHHLDMRTNRALYFIWWDQVAGTYRPTHPAIPQMSPEEWRHYNSAPLYWLGKRARQALQLLGGGVGAASSGGGWRAKEAVRVVGWGCPGGRAAASKAQ